MASCNPSLGILFVDSESLVFGFCPLFGILEKENNVSDHNVVRKEIPPLLSPSEGANLIYWIDHTIIGAATKIPESRLSLTELE
jgi:hypothetical protein